MKKISIVLASLMCAYSFGANAFVSTKFTGSCSALAKETGKYPDRKIKGFRSESVFKKMEQANQFMSEGQKQQAKVILDEIRNSSSDGFTLSVVYQYLSRMAYDEGNFSKAVEYARKVVELDSLPVNAILNMKKQVAYAYYAKKDYTNAINWLKQYFDQVINPPVSDYKLLAGLYAQKQDYRNAICPAFIALKKTPKVKDKEALYKNLFSFHYQLKDLKGSAKILSEMINVYPEEKKYWLQLFSIEFQLGNKEQALAVSELGYKKGHWNTEKDIKNLASLHTNNGAPHSAAIRLEEGMNKGIVANNTENLKLIARYWDQAKADDKAIAAYTRLASSAGNGKYDFRIGNILFSKEKYKEAIRAFEKAASKGGLSDSDAGNNFMQLGAARFYLGQETAAINALEKAKSYSRTRNNAISWIGFIKEKQRIREILRKDAEQLEAEVAAEKAESESRTN